MAIELYSIYNQFKDKSIILSYCGPIMQGGIEFIAVALKDKLAADDTLPFSASQSIFSIFVEQIQNVFNYSAEKQISADNNMPNSSIGIFIIGRTETAYFTQCGNKISNDELPIIESNIKHINSLNKEELKAFYREKRRSQNNNPKSLGAGLGFIEMARRSSSPLEFEFTRLDDDYSFFSLYATVTTS